MKNGRAVARAANGVGASRVTGVHRKPEPTKKRETLTEANARLKAEIESLKAQHQVEKDSLLDQCVRSNIEVVILLEGCAIMRETAVNVAPVVASSTRLNETIFKVMRDPDEMRREIERRQADSRRTWWNPGSEA